jgi:CheY-like chemotaxis protein
MISLDGKTIVVADDELGFRELIGDELALAGADPVAVESGDHVPPVLAKQKIDAVISDIRMPKIDGLTLLDLLKKQNRDFPVFMLTGFSDAQTEDIYDRGADGLYSKPCDMDEVIRDLHRSLLPLSERYLAPLAKSEAAVAYSITVSSRAELQGGLVNLGRGGMFLKPNGSLPRVGSEIHFTIEIVAEKMQFTGVGICRWSKVVEGFGEAFGVQFLQLEASANQIFIELFRVAAPVALIPKKPGGAR